MGKLNIADELVTAGRPMNIDERIFDVLSKGGRVLWKDCNPIAQATWDAWERGYRQAVDDIKKKRIEL